MAKLSFKNVKHSYLANPQNPSDYALQDVDFTWSDGGAYALLGPSGCGKTTLLNIISGLLKPSEGQILFDSTDVTAMSPDQRHIAQVFQFPVIYDTMTVYDNLAFPLKNRGVDEASIKQRVEKIAEMLDLSGSLHNRASGLTADGKQKISLGRGLVRTDVNAILFDEPLTVIDPHLKWLLRSKLKELHQQVKRTMIYVTHDQTEALTFADKVVVMHEGQIVQVGTPTELFEKPKHTFVGHFIGSPGMNIFPCKIFGNRVMFEDYALEVHGEISEKLVVGKAEVGVRPEFITFSNKGIPVNVVKVDDIGRLRIVEVRHKGQSFKMVLKEGEAIPDKDVHISFDVNHTHVYCNGWVIN